MTRQRIPHGEWRNNGFSPNKPIPQPVMTLKAMMNFKGHENLGKVKIRQKYSPVYVTAIADTGAQTGPDLLTSLSFKPHLLVWTRHRLVK